MANFSYNQFKKTISKRGIVQQNRFEIDLLLPTALRNSGLDTRRVSLYAKGINIPGVNVATNNVVVVGEPLSVAYSRTFGEGSVTFYVDRTFETRRLFEQWVNAIQNPVTRTLGWYNDTIADIRVSVFDRTESTPLFILTLKEAKPKSLGTLQMDQANNDLMTFDVTFDYRNYTTSYPTTSDGADINE